MSRERARRREARQAEAAASAARAEQRRLAEVRRTRARAARTRTVRSALGLRPVPVRSALRRATLRRWLPVLVLLVLAHGLLWLLSDSWAVRLTALGVSVLAAPLVWVVVTDSANRGRSGYRRRP